MQQIYSGELGGDGSGAGDLNAAAQSQIGSGDQVVAHLDFPVPIDWAEGAICGLVGAIGPNFGMQISDCHVENSSTLVIGWTQS